MVYQFVLWLVWAQYGTLLAADSQRCTASAGVERRLNGQGFHKDIQTQLSFVTPQSVCSLSVIEEIAPDFYLDKYQLSTWQEKNTLVESNGKIIHYSFSLLPHIIDVESPSFATDFTLETPKSSNFRQNVSFSQRVNLTVVLKYPLHVRYQEPGIGADYVIIKHITNLSVIVGSCNNEQFRICLNETDLEKISIPVGRREHKNAISLITMLVTCLAAAYVASVLRRNT